MFLLKHSFLIRLAIFCLPSVIVDEIKDNISIIKDEWWNKIIEILEVIFICVQLTFIVYIIRPKKEGVSTQLL